MDNKEQELLNKTAELHNMFVELDQLHPDELPDWVRHIHALQRIVLSRPTLRSIKENDKGHIKTKPIAFYCTLCNNLPFYSRKEYDKHQEKHHAFSGISVKDAGEKLSKISMVTNEQIKNAPNFMKEMMGNWEPEEPVMIPCPDCNNSIVHGDEECSTCKGLRAIPKPIYYCKVCSFQTNSYGSYHEHLKTHM